MSATSRSTAADIGRAFATYALVPYLGILFCPGALMIGGAGVFRSQRLRADRGVYRDLMLLATLESVAQLLLWWILYKVPEWSRGF
jgi:hypothetical protein